ncbi:MAG: response regulator transcription factor [Anaerolineaceae bacterium]
MNKILVIDDDSAMTDLLSLLLPPSMADLKVVNDGARGVELAKKFDPDIILLDLMMPGMDGWQVCEAIRKFSQVPIIILSALDKPSLVAKALDVGADDFLVKPVPARVLLARVQKLARVSRVESLPILAAFDKKIAPSNT